VGGRANQNDSQELTALVRSPFALVARMVGFCWGGKVVMMSSTRGKIGAGVGLHPSFLVPEDGAKADCPQLFMPAGNDPPIDPIFDALNPDVKAKSKKKRKHLAFFPSLCRSCFSRSLLTPAACALLTVFAEMDHGWSLRSDMSDPEAKGAKMANEAIEDAIGFLNQNL